VVAMRTLLIVFHSLTGGTRQMAEAAAQGAQAQSEVSVRLLPAVQAQPADVLGADGYIFATPEMLAAVSGLMKDFFDRTYYLSGCETSLAFAITRRALGKTAGSLGGLWRGLTSSGAAERRSWTTLSGDRPFRTR
jgi:multimeric flavodoxin WrbA